jgi:hypothetical protein
VTGWTVTVTLVVRLTAGHLLQLERLAKACQAALRKLRYVWHPASAEPPFLFAVAEVV